MTQERRIYQNETIFVPDLARERDVVSAITFENCTLRGPAIVTLLADCVVDGVSFGVPGDIEAILWEVPPKTLKVGAIGFQDCVIRGGSTEGIGFAGVTEQLDMLRRAPRR
jgi:hypothetical protein